MSYTKPNDLDNTSGGDTINDAILKNDDNVDDVYDNLNELATNQTASRILTQLKTVDGPGSGLDADLLDGEQGAFYSPSTHTHSDKLSNIIEDTTPELGGDLDGKGKKQYNTIVKTHAIGTSSSAVTLDCEAYNRFTLEPTAAIDVNFTNVEAGAIIFIEITGGGDHTLTWKVGGATTNFRWDSGEEPDWSTTTGIDIASFVGRATDSLAGALVMGEIST